MALIRNWADIATLTLTEAEEALIDACKAGEECVLGDGNVPSEHEGPDRRIHADLLRYLILGGCETCQIEGPGLRLRGALIDGALDLSFQAAHGTTDMINCRFPSAIIAMEANLSFLTLNGSDLTVLNAQGAKVEGDVLLRGVTSSGEISLSGATIGGQLACNNAILSAAAGPALNAQGLETKGSVFLRGVTTSGEVLLTGAMIGGQLSCTGATFAAKGDKPALHAQDIEVKGGLIWRKGTTVKDGAVILTAARLSDLTDDLSCWQGIKTLRLDGLTYDRIYGRLDVVDRLEWLATASASHENFRPQPHTHLASVYRAMGRDSDARKVLRDRERREHADLRRRRAIDPDGTIDTALQSVWADTRNGLRWLWEMILRYGVGYGFAPERAFYALIAVWLLAVTLSHQAWQAGDFAPNSGPIQISADWRAAVAEHDNPALVWSAKSEPGEDWETFNRYAYAADLVIPIINLGQTNAWTPSTNRGPWGQRLWRYGFLLNIAGWLITALGAAAVTGLVRRD